jgi:two-component system response regulator (stage 0 sporulation protein F)
MQTKKIVIVDDDENIRKTFVLLLGKKYRVSSHKDSEEALAKLRNARPDLVIVDFKLPRLNGLELIKRLRETGFEGEAMLISAHPDMVKIEDLSRFSISHFFVKPLDLNALNVSIDRVLQPKKLLESTA